MLALITFWSCEKEEIKVNETTNENYVESVNPLDHVMISKDRLVFEDAEHFKNCLDVLSQMTDDELDRWEESMGFQSYRTYSNNIINKEWEEFMTVSEAGGNTDALPTTKITDMPKAVSALVNCTCEYQVGEKIIWINEGYEYIIDNLDEEILNKVKQDKSTKASYEGVQVNEIKRTFLTTAENNNSTKGWQDARYQYQFSLSGHTYKFVFECCVWRLTYSDIVEVRNKFEYLKKRTLARDYWAHAGQSVSRYTNVTVTVGNGYASENFNRSTYGSNDLVFEHVFSGNMNYIRVEGTMSASTNNGGSWPVTYSYAKYNTVLWNQSIPY